MGLRVQNEADLAESMEDEDDFGWPITVTDPNGVSQPLIGLSTDIMQIIDPDTGMVLKGRTASVALRISSLVFSSLPEAVANSAAKPWRADFEDINGSPYTFKVKESSPDRAIGIVVCILETYQP